MLHPKIALDHSCIHRKHKSVAAGVRILFQQFVGLRVVRTFIFTSSWLQYYYDSY